MSFENKLKNAKPTQFFDTDVVDGWDKWIEQHDKQVKADAIEEFLNEKRIQITVDEAIERMLPGWLEALKAYKKSLISKKDCCKDRIAKLKKVNYIFENGCLSEATHGCDFDGSCEEHERAKIVELIEECEKQVKTDVIDEILDFIGFRNLDDWSQRYINAKDLIDKLNEMKD